MILGSMVSKIKITLLGTSDQIPSRSRNHTSLLLNFNEENILIDCGEGTQRQFRKANLNPCKITKILITHWHGDHVLGLPGLLSTLALSGYNKNLEIYGPIGIKLKIENMMKLYSFHREYSLEVKEIKSGKFFENEEFYLEAEEMEHGISCLAYSFIEKGHIRIKSEKVKELGSGPHLKELKQGKDIVFNGKKIKSKNCIYHEKNRKISVVMDTKFNKKIISFVKNSDLFISEGTYSSELKKEAEEHFHLTVGQVADIAKKAKVKKLVLTHVSSRYLNNLDGLLKEAKKIFKESYLPRDLDFFLLE
jgi:ribonuclease Z